mmetsp:Transcript_4155/g.5813  ORF Transcript_4155/g.5813 Transcript_4155/m.5813 type:complete len:356 (+) Transcript_4155:47-1114(+)
MGNRSSSKRLSVQLPSPPSQRHFSIDESDQKEQFEDILEESMPTKEQQPKCTEDFISNMPPEMMLEVFRNLNGLALCRCSMVCKRWNTILLDERFDDVFWKPKCLEKVRMLCEKDAINKIVLKHGVLLMASSWRSALEIELVHHGLENIINICSKFLKEGIESFSSLFLDMRNLTLLPNSIFDQHKLGKLFLSSNKISVLPPSINRFKNLRELYLSSNLLNSLREELFGMTTLEQLHLRDNYFTQIPEQISKLTNLRQLGFGYNLLKSVPMCLSSLRSLTLLSLSNNDITVEGLQVVSTLTNLVHLQISYNLLESVPPGIMLLQKLKTLKIQENPIPNLTEEYFSSLPNLKDINI